MPPPWGLAAVVEPSWIDSERGIGVVLASENCGWWPTKLLGKQTLQYVFVFALNIRNIIGCTYLRYPRVSWLVASIPLS